MPTKARKEKEAARAASQQFEYKGVKQVGDCRLWTDKNVLSFYKLSFVPPNMVGPGDIVDDIDPKQRYTFYKFVPTNNDDSARELDGLRRSGYIKCSAPRFISPTEKFETRDGVLVLGQGVWYACPEAKAKANRKAAREGEGAMMIAGSHAELANSELEPGFTAQAQTRADSRGQRQEVE